MFAETGLVVTPFLPGDSLLFAAGALAATGALDARLVLGLLIIAAVAGNTVNYAIGRSASAITSAQRDPRWARCDPRLRRRGRTSSSTRTAAAQWSSGRFVPIVRTFVPFVAGVAEMTYRAYVLYNIVGGSPGWACAWARAMRSATCRRQDNFSLVAIGIVVVSLLPMVFEFIKHRRSARL